MKKFASVISLGILFLSFVESQAQWQPDVRLTNDPAESWTSNNSAWCIAANGNVIHVVWYDERDGNDEIYYKRSMDGGVSWGEDTRLTNNSATSGYPSVSVSGSVVLVVWDDFRDGNLEIYCKRSTDGGVSWEADTRLTNSSDVSWVPSISVSGSVVHVVWNDSRDGNLEIYYKRSIDGGITWGADTRLTINSATSEFPSVSVSGSVVHVVWYDSRDGNLEIYYKRSIDGGITWGADTRLTNNADISWYTSISAFGSVVHVVWTDLRDGSDPEIYYKRSTDGGVSWEADTRLTNSAGISYFPSVAVSGSVVHVVWYDLRDINYEIYYKRSTDEGLTWGTDTRLTNNSAVSWYPSVAVSGSTVHVVWQDLRDLDGGEIYYKRDPIGNPTGIEIISSEVPEGFKLGQNYPNPFNPSTIIAYDLPAAGHVTLSVYDVLGGEVQTLVNESQAAGRYKVEFDATGLASGVYLYRITAGSFVQTRKLMLLR
jgi:hypothetical protein